MSKVIKTIAHGWGLLDNGVARDGDHNGTVTVSIIHDNNHLCIEYDDGRVSGNYSCFCVPMAVIEELQRLKTQEPK